MNFDSVWKMSEKDWQEIGRLVSKPLVDPPFIDATPADFGLDSSSWFDEETL